MADFRVDDGELVLLLTELEKFEGVHRDLSVPVSSVQGIDVLDDALGALESEAGVGIRTGTGIPGVLVVGTVRHRDIKSFVVIHHGHPRGVRVRLHGEDYDEFIVGSDAPEALAARLAASAKGTAN